MPVIEDLLPPPHGEIVTKLAYLAGSWHALAKLRIHTKSSVRLLRKCTELLGIQLRKFDDVTCASFLTKELPLEVAARARKDARRAARRTVESLDEIIPAPNAASGLTNGTCPRAVPAVHEVNAPGSSGGTYSRHHHLNGVPDATGISVTSRQVQEGTARAHVKKLFSLQTYKIHALGDYADTIVQFGTTDSYSTQIVSTIGIHKHTTR